MAIEFLVFTFSQLVVVASGFLDATWDGGKMLAELMLLELASPPVSSIV